MITSWADEEDKANAKYYSIRGKSKNNMGGNKNNSKDHRDRHNNNYLSSNRKRKPDNTVATIQRPVKDNLLAIDFRQPRTLVMLWFELHYGTNPPLGMLMI
jgi:hypothetical protein